MIVPKEVEPLDTLEFCSLLKIDKEDFKKRFTKAVNYARWLPSVFLKQLAKEDYAYLQEKLQNDNAGLLLFPAPLPSNNQFS